MQSFISAIVCVAGLISASAAAENLTKVTGDHVDFYFEQNFEYFGTPEVYTVQGDTLTLNSRSVNTISTNAAWAGFIVVPHDGYLLSNSIARKYDGYLANYGNSEGYQVLSAFGNIDSGTFDGKTFHVTQAGVASYSDHYYSTSGQVGDAEPENTNYQSSNKLPGYFSNALQVDAWTGLDGSALSDGLHVSFTVQGQYATAVPEPASYPMLLAGVGLIGVVVSRRRKISL